MHAQQALDAFKQSLVITTPEVGVVLSSPAERQNLYKLLVMESLEPLSLLIRAAFQKEVEYRNMLWESAAVDGGEFFEGIYRCAFLLYRIGNPEDIFSLWQAKHLNMDVGSSLGAEFFIGAGLHESIAFIKRAGIPESDDIVDYISEWFAQPEAMRWQEDWEDDMQTIIGNA